ncbi:hypothetical protein [Vibrio nigripulchritudo]|uniref:hypothetical protein n=1 Tax=Vibrio nigripulchritudo TaxID=28173 RepID=UPI0012D460CA|nr:hypothetical protein [Vibrio nigripulchritudo]
MTNFPQWADPDHTILIFQMTEDNETVFDFVACANDCETHGRALFARAKAGEFGDILPFDEGEDNDA